MATDLKAAAQAKKIALIDRIGALESQAWALIAAREGTDMPSGPIAIYASETMARKLLADPSPAVRDIASEMLAVLEDWHAAKAACASLS